MAPSGEEQINILIQTLNAEESKKEISDATEYIKQRIQGVRDLIDKIGQVSLPASFVLGGKKQIDELMASVSGQLSFEDFEKQIAGLNEWDLTGLRNEILKTIDIIADLKVPEHIKMDPLEQLQEKFNIVNESLNRFWDDQDRQAQSNKVEQFLGRYKFALLLIGGAVGGIVGMMKYSSVFGTMMDLVGQSVGYLADVILMPLIPAMMILVDWIIGVADWFDKLPDPIKFVISSIFTLIAFLLILRTIGILEWVKNMLTGLYTLATGARTAGVLTGAGFAAGVLAGLLIGFAAVYAMIQTGILNSVAKAGDSFQETQPAMMAAITAWLAPLGLIGIPIIDLLSGQIDKIPFHMQMAKEMVLESVRLLVGEFGKYALILGTHITNLAITIGSIMEKIPAVSGLGTAIVGAATDAKSRYESDLGLADNYIKKKADMIDQYRNLIYGGVNVEPNYGNYVPGDIFKGSTSTDQMNALWDNYYEKIKELNQNSNYLGGNADFSNLDTSIQKLMEITDASTKAADATQKYTDAINGVGDYSSTDIQKLKDNADATTKIYDDLLTSIFNTNQVADQVTSKIPDVTANNIEKSIAGINVPNSVLTSTVEAYKELAKTMRSALSSGDITLISRATTPTAAAQPAVTEHNTYTNYFTINEASDADKVADTVIKKLERGKNRVSI